MVIRVSNHDWIELAHRLRILVFRTVGCQVVVIDVNTLAFFGSYYLRQVNGVNGGDTIFVRCVCVCVCACLCAAALNANTSKTVKVTDFIFDVHVPRDSPDITP